LTNGHHCYAIVLRIIGQREEHNEVDFRVYIRCTFIFTYIMMMMMMIIIIINIYLIIK